MEWLGGCLCGAVRFRAHGAPLYVGCCHCRRCQRVSGSAFWTWVGFAPHDLEWIRGKPKLYQSSSQVERGFCAECGSAISFHRHDAIAVSITSLDAPERVTPEQHIFIEMKLPWLKLCDDLPQVEGFGPEYEHRRDADIQ